MNKLDDKVIVDREVFVGLLDMARRGLDTGFFGDTFHQDFNYGEQALAADLTGWVAVPANFNLKMYHAGAAEQTVRETYSAMLEASPPLPGTGEKS